MSNKPNGRDDQVIDDGTHQFFAAALSLLIRKAGGSLTLSLDDMHHAPPFFYRETDSAAEFQTMTEEESRH